MSTTSSTLAGIMSRLQADSLAVFSTQSVLINAVRTQIANGANSVQFPSFTVPSGVSAHTEGASLSATAVSISAVAATLAEYPVLARVSLNALNGGSVTSMDVALQLAGTIAATVDKNVTALFSSFTGGSLGTAGTALSLDTLITAIGALKATKFTGTPVAVLHPKGWSQIAKDIVDVAGFQKDALMGEGYMGRLFGADIFVSAEIVPDGSDDAYSAVYMKEAIGLGYRDPLMDLMEVKNPSYVSVDILGYSLHKAVLIQAGAGVKILHDTVA